MRAGSPRLLAEPGFVLIRPLCEALPASCRFPPSQRLVPDRALCAADGGRDAFLTFVEHFSLNLRAVQEFQRQSGVKPSQFYLYS